ncbi:MAG: NAD(P)-dependent oxidoreductase [Bacteroidia bacterium]
MAESNKNSKEIILVTGGSGLIGTKLIDRLADRFQCIGLDKVGNPFPNKKSENINFDITSEKSIRAGLERIQYAYSSKIASVVHLAAYYDFSGEPSPLYEEVTVKGTEKLLDALQEMDVQQFIFSSTNLVYKAAEPGEKINENWPLNASWNYPESKVKTEKLIRQKRGRIPAVMLRLAGAYDEEGNSIPISHQVQRIYEKELTSYFYPGDLLHGNAFLHLDDMVDAIIRTIDHRDSLPEEIAINISESKTYSYGELQDKIGELIHGEEWHTMEIPKPLAKIGAWLQEQVSDPFIKPWMVDRADDHYEMDISRAKEKLDWEPRHDLKSTLPKMIKNLKLDPEKWYEKNDL